MTSTRLHDAETINRADVDLEHIVCRACHPPTAPGPKGLCGADAAGQSREGVGHVDALALTRCPMCAEQLRQGRGCPHAPKGSMA